MGDATPLNSSNATATTDRRILELLMVVMMTHYSLFLEEGADDDDDAREIVVSQEQQMTELLREAMTINARGNQSAVSMELLVATQRLLDAQLRSMDGGEKGRVVVSSSAADQQLMDSAAAAKKKATAAAKKKRRNKRNKAAAKHKGTKIMSRLGGGIISLIMIAALIVSLLLLIPQSDGSSEGKVPPTLPPSSTSSSLRRRDLQSSMSSIIVSQSPIFSPAVGNPPTKSASPSSPQTFSGNPTQLCFDAPNWKDLYDEGCEAYEKYDAPGCPTYGSLFGGEMGVANDNCCYCGGGSHTLPPTGSPTITSSPTKSGPPSSSPSSTPSSSPTLSSKPTEFCLDTPNWKDAFSAGCDWYRENRPESGCQELLVGSMGPAAKNCCHCGKEPCVDTPNWNDGVHGCTWYEENDSQGCPKYGGLFGGKVMGLAKDHCCYCKRPVVALVTPSAPPSISTSPTVSSSPTSSICTDTPGWYDQIGYDCSWYEVMDVPGCPQYGSQSADSSSTAQGSAKDSCCYCKNDVANTFSPTVAPSSSGTCVDTPGWKDGWGDGCEWYHEADDPGCPQYGNDDVGEIGPAAENCCYCKNPTCENFRSRCQVYATHWTNDLDLVRIMCNKAASCSCGAADHVKIVSNPLSYFIETVGLYNECKCDFWLRLCEDTRGGDACDYAAEYCCGDYNYKYEGGDYFDYRNSPHCYCDFFTYAEKEFGHKLKPKALNISKEFSNLCGGFENRWVSSRNDEKESLEAIYEATNGQNWTNNNGWMNETVDHCLWYGISCDVDRFVTSIDLRDNNLAGQFPVYTQERKVDPIGIPHLNTHWNGIKYGLANLYMLKMLDLANNKLTGTIEYGPLYNLHSLSHFDVSGNRLSGQVEALVAPSLTHADFSNNSFTSMRRCEEYKVRPLQTLRYCDASDNAIQQDATGLLENIPPNIEHFIASNNEIYGSLPLSLNKLQKLRQFNMASNALSGDLPAFSESFATLQELDVSNQTSGGFIGLIPGDIWRSLSLKILNLAGNQLTGTIPSLVGNLAVLEVFDLSNNLLESSIPPELGMLQGSLKRLDLSNNILYGIIPSQIGQLQRASVFLQDNVFDSNTTAPLSLCLEREVEEFDLADDATLCPAERYALVDFYDSTKGAEWTDRSKWLGEYGCCDWKGVTCDDMNHVIKLNLTNNGLSGRLSESIGNLTFIKKLDLSDNDIKGSIPNELGLLYNLTYLRLSYNAFTGTAPEGLGEMKGLQLLQLQSNRITEMPIIPRLDDSIHGQSTFVTDCGVPSAFDEALECKYCTMCCNANDDCYPQEETQVIKWGLKDYGTFAAVLFACFFVFCCIVALFLYVVDKRKNNGNTLTLTSSEDDDKYALSKIGKLSVYSYFVTDNIHGWVAALATLGIQIVILIFFINASEANLQDDKIDIQFTWKCPRDTDVCKDKADLTAAGWVIFCLLMFASLAKDFIGGFKLIHHSAKSRNSLKSSIRYFFGGMCLFWITLFALYVSTIYNKALATSNTEIIVNSVIILFVMDLDEWIFSLLTAVNEKWTAHAEDDTIDKMKKEIADHKAETEKKIADLKAEMEKKIADHKAEMEKEIADHKAEMKKEIALHQAQIASQQKQEEIRKLCELYKNLL